VVVRKARLRWKSRLRHGVQVFAGVADVHVAYPRIEDNGIRSGAVVRHVYVVVVAGEDLVPVSAGTTVDLVASNTAARLAADVQRDAGRLGYTT
jgi:hypothetical protein